MTKDQEQERLDTIDAALRELRQLIHTYPHADDYANSHLDRACAHLREAWIAADGQAARSVEQVVIDIIAFKCFAQIVAKSQKGEVIEALGQKWRVE